MWSKSNKCKKYKIQKHLIVVELISKSVSSKCKNKKKLTVDCSKWKDTVDSRTLDYVLFS